MSSFLRRPLVHSYRARKEFIFTITDDIGVDAVLSVDLGGAPRASRQHITLAPPVVLLPAPLGGWPPLRPQTTEPAKHDMLIGQYEPEIQRLIQAARRTLRVAFRGATETCDAQAHLLGYSYGPGYKGTVATLILSKKGVKIGIPYGSSLPDPAHLLAGEGKVHRHVAIKDSAELKAPELRALLQNALRAWETRTSQRHALTSA